MPLMEQAAIETKLPRVAVTVTRGKRLCGEAYPDGRVKLVLPISKKGLTAYWQAQLPEYTALKLYLLIVHEFKHVKDFYSGATDMGKLGPHDNRPCERRAYKAENQALYNMPPFLTLKLAAWLARAKF